jgi:cytochrome b involved in lipid metabolism
VGEREVPGEVIRGMRPAATPTPTVAAPSPTAKATPTPTATKAGYTMADVKSANTSAKCWSVIDGYVYDLTKWIPVHRGGPQAITFLCGKDGTSAFKAQHDGSSGPVSVLSNYLLGPLTP